jgi:hypothetical protein
VIYYAEMGITKCLFEDAAKSRAGLFLIRPLPDNTTIFYDYLQGSLVTGS